MAAALRLIGSGDFGEQVVRLLADMRPDAAVVEEPTTDAGRLDAAFEDFPSVVVLALWRPSPGLCEKADELAAVHGVPWLPIVLDYPSLRIGPYIDPSQRPCFRCYRDRRTQHDEQHQVTGELHDAYDASPELGPRGHLPHQVRLAASAAVTHIEQSRVGRATTVHLVHGRVHTHPVVACHGCERCGKATRSPRTTIESWLSTSRS